MVPELRNLEISHLFLMAQHFRHPPQVIIGADQLPHFAGITDGNTVARKMPRPRQHSEPKYTPTSPSNSSTATVPYLKVPESPSPHYYHPLLSTSAVSAQQSMMPATTEYSSTSRSPHLSSPRSSITALVTPAGLTRSNSSVSDAGDLNVARVLLRRRSTSSGIRHEPYRPLSANSSGEPLPAAQPLPNWRHVQQTDAAAHNYNARPDMGYPEGIGHHFRSTLAGSDLVQVATTPLPLHPSSHFRPTLLMAHSSAPHMQPANQYLLQPVAMDSATSTGNPSMHHTDYIHNDASAQSYMSTGLPGQQSVISGQYQSPGFTDSNRVQAHMYQLQNPDARKYSDPGIYFNYDRAVDRAGASSSDVYSYQYYPLDPSWQHLHSRSMPVMHTAADGSYHTKATVDSLAPFSHNMSESADLHSPLSSHQSRQPKLEYSSLVPLSDSQSMYSAILPPPEQAPESVQDYQMQYTT